LLDNEYDKNANKPTWDFKLKDWVWFSQFSVDGKLNYLACKDQNGKARFTWGTYQK